LSPYLTLVLGVLLVSVGAILVRLANAPALAVAFYRMTIAALLLSPFATAAARGCWPTLKARDRLLLAASGIALALHFATWIASLSHTSVAASVLLVNTSPLFAIVLSRVFLGEDPPLAVKAAILLAMAGAGTRYGNYPARTWLALAALAVVPTLGGHGLTNRALRSLPAPTIGLFLLGEPLIASILAMAIFHETPSAATLVGGAIVLAALVLVVTRTSRRASSSALQRSE
jgi:drug/metabolite transporter (DMT)-like permease